MDSKAFNIEQERLENTIQKINEREYYVSDLIDKKHSQIRQSINSTGDEVILNNRKHEMNILNSARKEPYFGRIDISSVEDGEETFYLGKQGIIDTEENIVVVDWRMPLASVFYNFTPGQPKQHYEVETDKRTYRYTVDVKQKREYKIENQKIEKINQYVADEKSKENKSFSKIGEELSVTDEFLRELIKKSETSGYLKEIIATIQKEQNIAIRKPLDQNVIIQGVAGSGKSSIALHRISYLLFNNKKLKPTDILILGPSRMFLSSFESILPNLEIKDIDQETFQDFAIKILNLNTKSLSSTNTFFERKVFNEISHETISFKGSREFINILDIFLEEYKNKFINTLSNLKIIDKFLMKDELIKIYNGYSYLPFSERVDKFKNHVQAIFEKHLKDLQIDIDEKFEISSNFIKHGGLTKEVEKNMIDRLEEIKSFKKNKNRKALNEGLKLWKRKVEIPDPISLYKQILTPEILSHFRSTVSQNVIYDLKQNHNREIDYFDLPPLLYIYYSLYSDPKSYSHIVIDEAQDLSYAHFAVLKKITKTMTILGDVEQSIFIDYGQSNWEGVQELIFNSNKDMQLNMSTSYRSTKEIIEAANKVLTNQFPKHESITALNRSGPNVDINKINDGEDLLKNITTTLTKWKKKYNRVAIIHKDEAKAMRLTEYLKTEYQDEVSYINTDTTTNTGFISVLASYNSKGMEFDAVILANVNEATFPKDDFHARLLYVLLTRAQEEVQVFYQDTPSLLLKGLVEKEPIHASLFDDIL